MLFTGKILFAVTSGAFRRGIGRPPSLHPPILPWVEEKEGKIEGEMKEKMRKEAKKKERERKEDSKRRHILI